MLRTHSTAAQLDLFDPFLPEELKGLPAELGAVDEFLDDDRFFAPYRSHFDPVWGRPSVPIETYLRMMYLKHRWGLGYETLCKEVRDSITWRRFCRIGWADPVPHPTTLVKITRRVGAGAVEELNRALREKTRERRLIRSRTLRADTTTIEADISWPTDAGLLARATGAMGRAVRRVQQAGGATRTVFRDRSQSAGRRMRALTGSLRSRGGERKAQIERLTGELAGITRAAKSQAETVLGNARRTLRRNPGNGKLRRAITDMAELLESTERILSQTDLRLAGQTTIPDRMVSLSDPDARAIRKGKLGRPVEFGYKVMIIDDREGFIEGYEVYKGNPIDHELLAPKIAEHRAETGRAPAAVTTDRGFGIVQVEDELRELGVRTVAIPRRGRTPPERRQVEHRRHFKRLIKWRTGSEGRISHWKRAYGGRRTRLKGIAGATTWVGFGVLAHNLNKISTTMAATR